MQGGRDKGAVKGKLEDYMVTDEVVASTAQTMEDTARYLDRQYGGIRAYLHQIGICCLLTPEGLSPFVLRR